jgi:hypothetical protein
MARRIALARPGANRIQSTRHDERQFKPRPERERTVLDLVGFPIALPTALVQIDGVLVLTQTDFGLLVALRGTRCTEPADTTRDWGRRVACAIRVATPRTGQPIAPPHHQGLEILWQVGIARSRSAPVPFHTGVTGIASAG